MWRRGLVVGSAGNVSRRLEPWEGRPLLAITPRSKDYQRLTLQQVQVVDFEGEPVEGELVPSAETMLHVAVYRARPDVGAVMHTHSTYASALAVAGLPLPPVLDELVIATGGPVAVAEYGFSGTEELAERAVRALGQRNAVLLRNHGVLGAGADLREALAVCELVERAAQVYILARLLGSAPPLPAEVVELEQGLFR
ncbi:MAG: class II aldolase/adducin family protein, partial [Chloroflexi bacterium]|nr:class II aldolase/adducin family protein [Chloroflexota bacterium]